MLRCALPAALLLATASAAQAQRLLTLVPGVAEASSADGPGPSIGPVPTSVEVDLDLLRSAPPWLEVPTPDGSVLSAERSVFEDRGGGDLMWSGGHPDAGYDTVVLTVEGGRLVGRFGAAGGGAYQIHAASDGRGGMAPVGGPRPEGVPFCEVETIEEHPHDAAVHARTGAHAVHPPQRVTNPQSHDRLDILVAYTATAAENWAGIGGPEAAIRHAGDYLKMVFRNNDLPVEPHIVHTFQASAVLDRWARDLGMHELHERVPWWAGRLSTQIEWDGEVNRLRHEHRADLVHLFTGERPTLLGGLVGGTCGAADPLSKGHTAGGFYVGWTTNYPDPIFCPGYAVTFAHEIGHGLGADHEPGNVRGPEFLFRPYAYGHANLDVMPSIGSAMSYQGQIEPFFSSARIRPWGARLGIAGARDNERLLRETVDIVVRHSDYLRSLEEAPAQPTDLEVRYDGGAARLSWQVSTRDAEVYVVEYTWYFDSSAVGRDYQELEGGTEAIVPLPFTEPGARYVFTMYAWKGEEVSLRTSPVTLVIPGEPLPAPSDVSVALTGGLDVDVRWTDNSANEDGFELQLLMGGDPIMRDARPADAERGHFTKFNTQPPAGAEYGVRVFAYNSSGYSESSEVVTFRWARPGGKPGAVADLAATATGPTTARLTWTADPANVEYYSVLAVLPGWRDWRSRVPGDVGSLDFEDLPRGGRYRFQVSARAGGLGLPSRVYLTLGQRGEGPTPPSDLSWVREQGTVRLSWNDNSDDELGFEVQSSGDGGESWFRLLTVPADTEWAEYWPSGNIDVGRRPLNVERDVFRVFAYDERGFSLPARAASCRPDAETLCLRDSRFEVKMDWHTPAGESGAGRVAPAGTNESGLFHFFDPENWEVLIKVLDGCSINGRVWVLGASTTDLGYRIEVTDTVAGESRSYWNEPGQPAPAIVDTEAFPLACGDAATAGARSVESPGGEAFSRLAARARASVPGLVAADETTGRCEAGPATLCLGSGRFWLEVEASTAGGERHEGLVARVGTDKAGLFHFFDPENWEVLVKVLDGCAINGHHWVFAASATDMGLDLRVADTLTGAAKRYGTTAGQPAPAIVDTEALACAGGAAAR